MMIVMASLSHKAERAINPAEYSARMLDWRLGFADRTLTGYRATPNGLEVRAAYSSSLPS